ncbi:hypothetical protein LOD99_2275 [Oopsacas minuta]|uniref:Uncharacterized protein n=1 Tax=Oopsacas minuta TaxID=111878 RepID=A0AAV7K2Z9_9METZ|nr:hypothetical protein LOD99_2275 [Oopsacas minuta]
MPGNSSIRSVPKSSSLFQAPYFEKIQCSFDYSLDYDVLTTSRTRLTVYPFLLCPYRALLTETASDFVVQYHFGVLRDNSIESYVGIKSSGLPGVIKAEGLVALD